MVKLRQFILPSTKSHLLSRFVSSWSVLPTIQHPTLVPYLSVFAEGSEVWLVSEYIEGISLKELLKAAGGKLPEIVVQHILASVLRPLTHLHGLGLLHARLHMNNVLFSASSFRVCDYSWAAAPELPRDTGALDHFWASPHVLNGRLARAEDDLWAVGALTHYLTAGQPLLAQHTLGSARALLAMRHPDLYAGLRPLSQHIQRLVDVFSACLAPSFDRPLTANSVLRLLFKDKKAKKNARHEAKTFLAELLEFEWAPDGGARSARRDGHQQEKLVARFLQGKEVSRVQAPALPALDAFPLSAPAGSSLSLGVGENSRLLSSTPADLLSSEDAAALHLPDLARRARAQRTRSAHATVAARLLASFEFAAAERGQVGADRDAFAETCALLLK
eukprot:gnl/Chilomastix_cuspidata/2121.p1 GENE.gnl/Chilomastix_cuspidata/2121~~gnl/Chilomastix_cuspidata/2121.p1  ORF type:complete len:440 (-),score=149.39 gnl/Chilomastix_cuspidata/2121:32-1201(-)